MWAKVKEEMDRHLGRNPATGSPATKKTKATDSKSDSDHSSKKRFYIGEEGGEEE